MKPTYEIAMAAGRDAGTRNARAAGRSAWNEEDWNTAADTTARVMGAVCTHTFEHHKTERDGTKYVKCTRCGTVEED